MRISDDGNDMYICQICCKDLDSVKYPSTWRPDLTKSERAGNVCPSCVAKLDQPMSLTEYCRSESGGLTGTELTRYINRYYGHG